jgi:undecaprenyl-phosphate galactose phosphotransferase
MKVQDLAATGIATFNDASDPTGEGEFRTNFGYLAVKRALDLMISSAALVVLSPAMLCIWILVKLDGGPGFFGHERVGRDRKMFRCLKFRTMVVNADVALAELLARDAQAAAQWSASQKLTNDPRVTRIGRLLRASSLDELPQLFNILRGEMSLVGPRPVVVRELTDFYRSDSRTAYLSVRPGLTGLWQVSGRSDASYATRVALDTKYVRDASLLLDLSIIVRTASAVLLRKGAY